MHSLRDLSAKARIKVRLERILDGNFGDCKSVGEGVSELRIHSGPGYRVYYTIRGKQVVVLLCGSDKSSQEKAIKQAKKILQQIKE